MENKKFKVLILIHGLFPGYRAPIFKEIAKNISKDVELEILAIGNGRTPSNEIFNFKINVLKPKSIINQYKTIIPFTKKFDIIHYFPGSGYELLPLFNRKSKFIFHFISVSVSGNNFYDFFVNTIKKIQSTFADMALYTDKELYHNIKPVFKIKTKILPVGYASDLFFPCSKPKFSNKKMIIYHGSCHPNRKIERMIEVLNLLDKKFYLLIIGKVDKKYMVKLNLLIKKLNCTDRIVFKEMPQDEIREYIKNAYLCFSYVPDIDCYQDQFVLKNIEYLACQRPVITTSTRYNKYFQNEIGKKNILLCEDSIEIMAKKINSSEYFVNQFYDNIELKNLNLKLIKYSNEFFIRKNLYSYYKELKQ